MKITVHTINEDNMRYWPCPKNTMKEMDFERDYLPGVVAGEMGDFVQPEALKAQAIAARSYALQYILKGAAIYDTSKAQVYNASRAASKRYQAHRRAAEDTEGIILAYNGKPANTHYTHCNGGYVKKSSNAWEPGGYNDPWDDTPKRVGHGSGMSQVGAENMAIAGKSYREILAFYYPGTELMGNCGEEQVSEMTQAQKIIDFARAQVGKPYKLGASGPDEWDCSGLTKRAVQQVGYDWYHGATTQDERGFETGDPKRYGYWLLYGPIATIPLGLFCVLMNRDKRDISIMAHTALYDPVKRSVIQAGGYGGKGVHEDAIDGKDFKPLEHFTDWRTLKELTDAPEEPQEPTFPTLRKGSKGEYVKTLQNLLNQHGASLKVDGDFGPKTDAAVRAYQKENGLTVGVVGPQTWGSLFADEEPDEKQATLLVSSISSNEADELALYIKEHYPKATYVKQS